METRCQKCGSPVGADQAFCPRCGAVVGMADADARSDEGWDLAATMVGRQLPSMPQQRPAPSTSAARTGAAPARDARGISIVLLAVIGFAAVLLIGGLLIFLFYLNSQG